MTIDNVYDAFVVGAGFSGIYQLYRLVELGFSVKLIDKAGGPGGTWYWNKYPGAKSDSESFVYRFSFDLEDLKAYPWPNRYVSQPEILAYLEHVVDRYDLREFMQFDTELLDAAYDEDENVWRLRTTHGDYTARYLITALGLLTNAKWPKIPKIHEFQGEMFHTTNIPENHSFQGKKVGVIGCGSTGIQLIPALAPEVEHLTCFQRNPQYTVPAGNTPVTKEYRDFVNENYEAICKQVQTSFVGMGFEESHISALSVSDEKRERLYQEAWEHGSGLYFMFGVFSDITTDEAANRTACDFIRRKIDEIVKDPETAQKLKPTGLWARRPLCDSGYYETFNRENVELVDLRSTQFVEFSHDGISTADGAEHILDVVICATGFNAVDGSYESLNIRGRGGTNLRERWADDPTAYLGSAVTGFPNLFLITGPKAPFANIPPVVEAQVDFLVGMIERAEQLNKSDGMRGRKVAIETTETAERRWHKICEDAAAPSLLSKANWWAFGSNVEGRKRATLFFLGGLGAFRAYLEEETRSGYPGFNL